MTRSLLIFAALVVVFSAGQVSAKVIGKTVEYSSQGVTMKGYLAYDDAVKGERPGVLVVHEWWGLNDYARRRADMLAQLGYAALALDMYGEGKTATHPDDAGKFASEVMKNFTVARTRFQAAEDYLKKQPETDPARIAAIGYCFGGGVVLNMAAQGAALKGVASFHGSLSLIQPPKPGEVKAKIIVFHGGSDKFASPEQIEKFKGELKAAGADFKFIVYPDAVHSFTNPDATEIGKKFNLPLAYNEKADKESWAELQTFLKDVFQ